MSLGSVRFITDSVLKFALMNTNVLQTLNTFSKNFREVNYKRGDVVIRGDDEPTGVYLLKNGTVKMSSISEDGEELAVNIFKPGTFFPMGWALGEIDNAYYYQTLSSAKMVRVPKAEFVQFLKDNPEVLYDLTRRIVIGLDGLIFNIRHLLTGSASSKIAVTLYTLARRFGIKKHGHIEIGLTLTHQEISNFVGLTRETTTISINRLIKEGLILQKQRKLIVKDMEALKNYF